MDTTPRNCHIKYCVDINEAMVWSSQRGLHMATQETHPDGCTEQCRQCEEALRELREKYNNAFDNASDSIFIIDMNGKFLAVNSTACTRLGYTEAEFLSLRISDIDTDYDPEQLRERIMSASEGANLVFEAIHQSKDGTKTNVEVHAHTISHCGQPAIIGWAKDITASKRAEVLRNHVERIVQHDLRNSVSSAIQLAKILRDGILLTDEDRNKFLDLYLKSGLNMLATLDSALGLYRIEIGQYQIKPEVFDCLPIVMGLAETLALIPVFHSVRWEIRLEGIEPQTGAHCLCRAEPTLLQTALGNLLRNAFEASPPGGTVTVELTLENDCRITIRNQGVVPTEIRDKFFERYVTSGKSTGTGLGTYSAMMMVKAMKGTITMDTPDETNETVLTVRLPR